LALLIERWGWWLMKLFELNKNEIAKMYDIGHLLTGLNSDGLSEVGHLLQETYDDSVDLEDAITEVAIAKKKLEVALTALVVLKVESDNRHQAEQKAKNEAKKLKKQGKIDEQA
jgi:hypothetical protein